MTASGQEGADGQPAGDAPRDPGTGAGAAGPGEGTARTPKGGMSTGAKVLFGCLGLTVVGIIGVAVALTIGGLALKKGVESALGTVERQEEAGAVLRRIEEDHPFEPPGDGVVGEERLARFLGATEEAWGEIRPWAEDLIELRDQATSERGGFSAVREMASGARAVGGLARSRVALAESLDAHEMSLGEYVWTGIQLDRAVDGLEGDRSTEGVPQANLELARRHSGQLPRFDSDGGDDSGAVLAVAIVWGMTDLSTWQAMGLDTLTAR